MLLGFQHSWMIGDLIEANTWISCDGILTSLSGRGAAANPLPQGRLSYATAALPSSSSGRHVPPQEEATEAEQFSQAARSQLRVSLVQQMSTRMEETLLGRTH